MRYRRSTDTAPRLMTAKYASVCPETGKPIAAGDEIAYYPKEKKAYHASSNAAAEVRGLAFSKSWGMADAEW